MAGILEFAFEKEDGKALTRKMNYDVWHLGRTVTLFLLAESRSPGPGPVMEWLPVLLMFNLLVSHILLLAVICCVDCVDNVSSGSEMQRAMPPDLFSKLVKGAQEVLGMRVLLIGKVFSFQLGRVGHYLPETKIGLLAGVRCNHPPMLRCRSSC